MIELTYQLPDAVVADTKAFRQDVEKYLSGETSASALKELRVPMGIYEQRENDTYMVRVRGAAGIYLPHQVKLIAELSRQYGNGIIHATTRQNLQIHGVKIQDTPAILERLLAVGLSTQGGGGNTVRNISACPLAGACDDELFDVTPYALALTEYLLSDPNNFRLPRKFKVAFSGCGKDCGLASVADLGFFAHKRDGVRGFAVYAGGGMGAHCALAIQIEDFVPTEAIFEVAEAVKRLFDKHGDRINRSKARLRFVVEKLGVDDFRSNYRGELELVKQEKIQFPTLSESKKTARLSAVKITLPLGDIPAHQLTAIADIATNLCDGTIRTTQEQGLQLRAPESCTHELIVAVRNIDRKFIDAQPVRCVACAGASICRTGICLSRGLATAIETELKSVLMPFEALIRISGCPNSCGHHPVSPLGLYGSASRVNGRLVNFYNIVAGGQLAEGNSTLAQAVAKVPAKAVPGLLKEFFSATALDWQKDESFHDLMIRWGIEHLRELAKQRESVPPYENVPEYYRDFGSCTDFSLGAENQVESVSDVRILDIDESK